MRLAGAAVGIVAIAWASRAAAQDAPSPEGTLRLGDWVLAPVVEARLRAEYWHEVGSKDAGVLVERARLGVDAESGAFAVRATMQQVVVSGAGSDVEGGPLRLSLAEPYELWVDVHTPDSRSFLRAGRQAVAWGEGRLLGTDDWAATGRALDALRGHLEKGPWALEALGAVLTSPNVPAVAAYGSLFGARAEAMLDPRFNLELDELARIAEENPVPSLGGTVQGQTFVTALRAYGRTPRFEWDVEGAFEAGHVDALGKDRRAWAGASHVAYRVADGPLAPVLRLGGAIASGDSGGPRYEAFDPLLPDTHEMHGAMGAFAWSNEEEVSAGFALQPFRRGEIAVAYRYVRLAKLGGTWLGEDLSTLGAAAGSTQADLGHEWDVAIRWVWRGGLELSARYALMALGAGGLAIVRANQLGSSAPWQFASLEVSFRLP